ncbi:MAG: T9SS type A sorting domain-containing protein [Paludibacter sp.]|nr:T9SS type A sorting domain-containing protein [Paludibacter sp.]MDD4198266.1 T9SS type A sorting domain-containing protein [Paludibacter sp.]MDD4428032.1 T9SS type A sorting domain-containing protein [Paludibacter sp.]
MKTTTTLFVLLSFLLIQTGRCNATSNVKLLKLDSIVVSDFTKYEYSYNQQGQLISEKFFVVRDTTHMIYALMSLVEHHYENGRIVSSVTFYGIGGDLTINDRIVYEYDEEKISTKRREYYFNGQWSPGRKSSYSYGEDGLLSGIEYSVFTNNNFLLTEQAVYHYDEQSKELLSIVNQILVSENQWSNKTKTEFDYEAGNLILQTEYCWNDTINEWKATIKKEFIYDGSNNNEVIYRESSYSGAAFIVTLEKEIMLDSACPAENLILPYNNNLPYKVNNEHIAQTQKSSNYFYSLFTLSGIDLLDSPVAISVYPNPVKDVLNVLSDQQIDVVEVFDVAGRLSATYNGSTDKVNVSGLAQGVYYLKINSAGRYTTLKFIKR